MDEKLLQFEAAYGSIIWTRVSPKFSWWPAYIYNPSQLPENLKSTAAKHLGKKHAIYYYGMTSNCYGFALPNQCKDFATYRDEYIKQTIKKNERGIFDSGMNLADLDLVKPCEERLAWNHQPTIEPLHDDDVDNNNNSKKKKVKVEKAKIKLSSRNINSDKTIEEKIKDKIISNKEKDIDNNDNNNDYNNNNNNDDDDDDDDSVLSSDDEIDNYSSAGEDEKKKMKKILIQKNKKLKVSNENVNTIKEQVKVIKRILPDRDNNIYQSDVKKMKDAKLKEKNIENNAVKERLEVMKLSNVPVWQQMLSINSTLSTESLDISQSNNLLKQNIDISSSSSERNIRIRKLVDFLTTLSNETQTIKSDNTKILDLLKRIDKMSLSINEIQSFDVGKLISSLRKHSDPLIAATAKTLRSKFMDLITNNNANSKLLSNNQASNIKASTLSSSSSSILDKIADNASAKNIHSNSFIDIYAIKKSDSKKDLNISKPENVLNKTSLPSSSIPFVPPPAPPRPPLIEADLLVHDNFNEEVLSTEVRESVARIRATRMLHTTLKSTLASNRIEQVVYTNYNLNNSITDKYLCIISKLTFSLQESTLYKLRKRLLAVENPSDAFLTLVVKDKVNDLHSIFA